MAVPDTQGLGRLVGIIHGIGRAWRRHRPAWARPGYCRWRTRWSWRRDRHGQGGSSAARSKQADAKTMNFACIPHGGNSAWLQKGNTNPALSVAWHFCRFGRIFWQDRYTDYRIGRLWAGAERGIANDAQKFAGRRLRHPVVFCRRHHGRRPEARPAPRAAEVSAIQVSAVQQELTDAALACGPQRSRAVQPLPDRLQQGAAPVRRLMLSMFKRLNGVGRQCRL